MTLHWSSNLKKSHPMQLAPENPGEFRDRAYPYADTPKKALVYGGSGGQELIEPFIIVTSDSVNFRGQRGPIREVGVNGCQIDDILTFALGTLQVFNKAFPCRENSLAITNLEQSLHWLESRTRDRDARGVEGLSKD